jgi:hypothetical protein
MYHRYKLLGLIYSYIFIIIIIILYILSDSVEVT